MYKVTLSLKGDPRIESMTLPDFDRAMTQFIHAKAYYREIKRRLSITGDYTLSLSTESQVIKSEAL